MENYILAIDQGTTATTALVLTLRGATVGRCSIELHQFFPQPGWVEHDAAQVWSTVEAAVEGAINASGVERERIAAIGITNQRETTVAWDRESLEPIHHAVVWQCQRTADVCHALKSAGHEPTVRARTGLVLAAYFSATKMAWILDHVAGARTGAGAGKILCGTIDSFLVNRLTSGESHVTDITNASRTLLMDLSQGDWHPDLLKLFNVPAACLPRIVGSAEIVARTRGLSFLPDGIAIAGIAGDQQAALFGQACFTEGDAKCTYGTGAFALMNIGSNPTVSKNGLITTVAWRIGEATTYALEGSAFIAGAAVQWLRDGLGIIKHSNEVEGLAREVESTDGVAFVPALTGLGAPYWDSAARGALLGLTRGSTRAHIARAVLEGIAFQVGDLLEAMSNDAGREVAALRVDGGAASNDLLMQFQADISGVSVERPGDVESTARGSAMLAGIGAGLLPTDFDELRELVSIESKFSPSMSSAVRIEHQTRWKQAVSTARKHGHMTGIVSKSGKAD